ncbi:MAG: hypothetical protein QOG72_2709 [Sphingomonadales bacterium]|jgi:hypothetical protein|nr:hypothetical protein [Sphingomonadales bacterium]
MDYEPGRVTAKPKRALWPVLALPLAAFVAGLAAMGWLLANWATAATFLGIAPAPPPAAAPAAQPVAVEREPAADTEAGPPAGERLVIDPETTRRVNRLEERLALLDLQSRAAVGNADRAEGLLVAFAARRAIDRGVALGYIETLLRQRFAATEPQAVATVLTVARQPVTVQSLQKSFQEVAPHLSGGGQGQSWWGAFKTEMAGLVTIRRENTPSTQPSERLRRAGQSLEAGQVEVALLEVLRLPGHERADKWIADARRYVAAHRALDRLESAALLEPRAPVAPPVRPR